VLSVHKGENPSFHPSLSFRLPRNFSESVRARHNTFPVAHSWLDAFIPPRDITSAVSHSALTCLLHQFMCLLLSFDDSSGTSPDAKPICHWFTSGIKSISMSKMSGRWAANNFRTSYGWHDNSVGKVTRCGLNRCSVWLPALRKFQLQ
jgi:hypothetical protein